MSRGPDYFATTRWTLVVSAARPSSPLADQALEELCRIYWYPLYLFVRRQGFGREDAEDRVQSFLERLLRGRDLENLSAGQGRFRAFLLASMKHFLANDRRDARRQKRGGGHEPLPLDWNGADDRFQRDLVDATPSVEAAFDRAWAIIVVNNRPRRCTAPFRHTFRSSQSPGSAPKSSNTRRCNSPGTGMNLPVASARRSPAAFRNSARTR